MSPVSKPATNPCPATLPAAERVIVFDGVCKLCSAWSRFIIRYDRQQQFKLATVQSAPGQRLLAHFGLPQDRFDTLLLVEDNHCYQKSQAIFNIVARLGYPWRLFGVFRVLPRGFSDWCYDRIAQNRYRWFGRFDQCPLPDPADRGRFLSEKN